MTLCNDAIDRGTPRDRDYLCASSDERPDRAVNLMNRGVVFPGQFDDRQITCQTRKVECEEETAEANGK